MADLEFADAGRAELYGRVLLEGLSGPWARQIKSELGPAFTEMCRVLYERQRRRLVRDPVDLSADDMDWAAVRALAPLMLERYDDEFRSLTGHDLEELRDLGQTAIDNRREYRTPRNAISYAIGECEVVFPTVFLMDRTYVAAVPDERSWNDVVPDCARDRRDEFLVPLRNHFDSSATTKRWMELLVGSIDELLAWVAAQPRRPHTPSSESK